MNKEEIISVLEERKHEDTLGNSEKKFYNKGIDEAIQLVKMLDEENKSNLKDPRDSVEVSDFTPGEGQAPENEQPGFPEDKKYKHVTFRVPESVADDLEQGNKSALCIGGLGSVDIEDEPEERLEEVYKKAREIAESEFSDWLKEKHKISQHATKREELMRSCTHPEDRRIYPDENDDHYPDDMAWHCLNCGYAEHEEDESGAEITDVPDKMTCPFCEEKSLVDRGEIIGLKTIEGRREHELECLNPECDIKYFHGQLKGFEEAQDDN